MRFSTILSLFVLLATGAIAGRDPGTDWCGIHFDLEGDTNCSVATPFQQISVYLMLMNRAGPTNGIECSVDMTGARHLVVSTSCICPFEGCSFAGDDICGDSSADFPVLPHGAVILVTWSIVLQTAEELLFHIGPSSVESMPGGRPVLTANGVLRPGSVASGNVHLPVAGINTANYPVSGQVDSFGEVKCLFC